MSIEDVKCPNCGVKALKEVDKGRYVCEHCGYEDAPEFENKTFRVTAEIIIADYGNEDNLKLGIERQISSAFRHWADTEVSKINVEEA